MIPSSRRLDAVVFGEALTFSVGIALSWRLNALVLDEAVTSSTGIVYALICLTNALHLSICCIELAFRCVSV